MLQTDEAKFAHRVADAIKQLDYKVTVEPWPQPQHPTWIDRISSWLPKPSRSPLVPDMLVAYGKKKALVEAKPYPVLLAPIVQARHYSDYFGAPAIICVPDDAFPKIPESVCEWADLNNVVLAPFGKIGDELGMLLREPTA